MHVLIIGGGLAGPALALFLKKAGITSTIYEAYPQLENIGGALQIAPNGMKVMAALGLAKEVIANGSVSSEFRFYDHHGKRLASLKNGNFEKVGQPAVSIARNTFHRILTREAEKQGIRLEYQKRLSKISYPDDKKVQAHFEDGTTAEGDILVGADGIRSITRQLILPDSPAPVYTGFLGLGGFVPRSTVRSLGMTPAEQDNLHMVFGPSGFFGYGGANQEMMWWVNFESPEETNQKELPSLTNEEIRRKLLSRYSGWAEPVETMLKQEQAIVKTAIYTMPSLPTWHNRRVILIGDAAHALSPTSGQGASMALEDAMYLAKLLAQSSDQPEQIFTSFEQGRRGRVEKINKQANRSNQDKKEASPFATWLRNRFISIIMPLFGKSMFEWIHSYTIDWNVSKPSASPEVEQAKSR
ncbi:MAG TPA: FAD-dependent monooxygenase [Chloroflexia bacterium]|nr:FAD-dependent monooxygenase [Chloroflexia bacterium]